jgi:hypothetical protein
MTTQQPSPRDIEQARNVVEECTREAGDFSEVQLREHVAQALAQREAEVRAEYAAFADENGKPRKVLGTLVLTKDGCFVGDCAKVYGSYWGGEPYEVVVHGPEAPSTPWEGSIHARDTWSTRDAALAARKEGE